MALLDKLIGRFSPAAALRRGLRLQEQGDVKAAFLQLSRAARAGIPEAEFRVGRCYLEGAGVPPSKGDGVRWVERAASQGYVEAQALLATLCLHGMSAGHSKAGPDVSTSLFGGGTTGDPDFIAAAKWARLAAEDPTVTAGGPVFDAGLAQAVIRAQKRYGLEPTGTVNKQTLAALNVPVGQRVEQIIGNMERWRWLPQELPADRIQVNIAAAVLTVFHNDTPTLSMRAVTGRPGDETPMLSSVISSVVFNPPWNVPSKPVIVRETVCKELLTFYSSLTRNCWVTMAHKASQHRDVGIDYATQRCALALERLVVFIHPKPRLLCVNECERQRA